jgi:SAM-dependent methyltransferase
MGDLHALVAGFSDVAAVYERGRPEYPPHVVERVLAALGDAARPPAEVIDLGAGTGKLTRPLVAAGLDVVAVEPLAGMRAPLAAAVGAGRVVDARAEALPLAAGSMGGAVSADAFHWFDGERAAAELARVLRPGAAAVVLWTIDESDPMPWNDEVRAVLMPLWQASSHPGIIEGRRAEALDGHPSFGPVRRADASFEDELDRDGLLAWFASFSVVGALPDDRRAATMRRLAEIADRHGAGTSAPVRRRWRVEMWVTRRVRA